MDKERFAELVQEAVSRLPEEFQEKLENIDIVVAERPSRLQLRNALVSRRQTLFGLYEGVPLTKRGTHYGLVMPDKITIFQRSFEEYSDESTIVKEIEKVVRHEIAHHFGISDERLKEIENNH